MIVVVSVLVVEVRNETNDVVVDVLTASVVVCPNIVVAVLEVKIHVENPVVCRVDVLNEVETPVVVVCRVVVVAVVEDVVVDDVVV